MAIEHPGDSGKEKLWGTRLGFYLAAVGSALGLGNLWRFPFVTYENGGGAFVLLYVGLAFFVGLPVLVGELMLGKITRRGSVAAFRRLEADEEIGEHCDNPNSYWAGGFSVLSSLFVVAYYAVVSGWVLHFLVQFVFGTQLSAYENLETGMLQLRENGFLQLALASVHILFSLLIIVKGVQDGIEKSVRIIMPIFILLLGILVVKSLSIGNSTEALRFQFYPDFTKLTWHSPLYALGHVFFSLSIGVGTMIAFGSYLKTEAKIPGAGFRVMGLDTLISLFAGLLIFPMIVGKGVESSGPEMLFRAVPALLSDLENGRLFGLGLFLCLYLGALGSSIGLMESLVVNVTWRFKISRPKASWFVGLVALVFAIVPALSSSIHSQKILGAKSLFLIWDSLVVNGLLPIGVLAFCLAISKELKSDIAVKEFINDDSIVTKTLYSHWRLAIKFIVPLVIILCFVLSLMASLIRIWKLYLAPFI